MQALALANQSLYQSPTAASMLGRVMGAARSAPAGNIAHCRKAFEPVARLHGPWGTLRLSALPAVHMTRRRGCAPQRRARRTGTHSTWGPAALGWACCTCSRCARWPCRGACVCVPHVTGWPAARCGRRGGTGAPASYVKGVPDGPGDGVAGGPSACGTPRAYLLACLKLCPQVPCGPGHAGGAADLPLRALHHRYIHT